MASSACSGVWFNPTCHHKQLFHSEYRRSNQRLGAKILRCFPHCCPRHVDRSYCGSPLYLTVKLAPSSNDLGANDLMVVARFELSNCDKTLHIGKQYSMNQLLNQNRASTPWFHGVLLPPEKGSTVVPVYTYRLNNESLPKWHYHWQSSATKTQRLAKHVLTAYILRRDKTDERTEEPSARQNITNYQVQVLGIVHSPVFTLVSHRRAPPLAATCEEDEGEISVLRHIIRRRISTAFHSYQASRVESRDQITCSSETESSLADSDNCTQIRSVLRVIPKGSSILRHTVLGPLKDLAIISQFVLTVPVFDAMPSFCVREHIFASICQYWSQSSQSNMAMTVVTAILALRDTPQPSGCAFSSSVDDLFITVLKVVVWMVGDANIDWTRQFLDSHADAVTDKTRLGNAFSLWVEEFLIRFKEFWHCTFTSPMFVSSPAALRDLTNRIVTFVHRDRRFYALWPPIRSILEKPDTPLWNWFIEQLRETYVRKQVFQFGSPHSSRVANLTGEWDLDPPSFVVSPLANGTNSPPFETLSVRNVFFVAAQLLRWRIMVDNNVLLLQSVNSLLHVDRSWMRLVCDGTLRKTSVLPLGIVSDSENSVNGDYRGRLIQMGRRYQVAFYYSPAYRAVVTLTHESTTDSLRIVVECQRANPEYSEYLSEAWAGIWQFEAKMHRRIEYI